MAAETYRGVGGVNRKIKEMHRSVSGVNRKVKEVWRGVNGVNRKVFSTGPVYVTCTRCNGSGKVACHCGDGYSGSWEYYCDTCKTTWISDTVGSPYCPDCGKSWTSTKPQKCTSCSGTLKETCSTCKGTGQIEVSE